MQQSRCLSPLQTRTQTNSVPETSCSVTFFTTPEVRPSRSPCNPECRTRSPLPPLFSWRHRIHVSHQNIKQEANLTVYISIFGPSSWLQIQRSGFDSQRYQISWELVGLERGPLGLMSTIEELLGQNSSGSGLEIREYGRRDPSRWPRDTLYPQNLALTSPTSGEHSVGIVRSRTKAFECCILLRFIQLILYDTVNRNKVSIYINSLNFFSFLLNYMFRPLRAILRWDILLMSFLFLKDYFNTTDPLPLNLV
jgi:hypothetical protein